MRPWSWAAAWMLMLQLQLGAVLLRASAVDALDSAPATLPTLESTYNIVSDPACASPAGKP